ncbi:MAG: hypothetical protein ACJA2S_002343 [Cyclobacteriaceae bacterium]|jgi:hypothetical protein
MNTRHLNFAGIIEEAWKDYDNSRPIHSVVDISAMVSTNHVFRVKLMNGDFVIGKLSYFGKYEHFKEDHSIINALANNLPDPFANFIGRSLTKSNEVYTYRYKNNFLDAWVVFYNPIKKRKELPRRLDEEQIKKLGREVGKFHLACSKVKSVLPAYSKTLKIDLDHLKIILNTENGKYEHRGHVDITLNQIDTFFENSNTLNYDSFETIPVFIDWNIGNFSVTAGQKLFSRWDYDWFRMSGRMLDFYFFSRVVSDIGDRTAFSYVAGPLMEDRFILFLKEYHSVNPISENEIRFLKEAYRFFLLNYVVKDGRYFFHEIYATKLQREVYDLYLPAIDKIFKPEKLLRALKI